MFASEIFTWLGSNLSKHLSDKDFMFPMTLRHTQHMPWARSNKPLKFLINWAGELASALSHG